MHYFGLLDDVATQVLLDVTDGIPPSINISPAYDFQG